ncbi:hypothetical protein ACTD5D_17165 [Nocardia takedensis]|uniref:hypothetical protein n=1 Tax=Nocardia takedensis TaxID=259390 RepID=UPI000306EC35|nr:hypothetical protein [Nocardia takedensis]
MSEMLVNTTTVDLQHQPSVTGFVISGISRYFAAWADNSDSTIKGRIFDTDGDPAGGEFLVNTAAPGANTRRQRPTVGNSMSGPVVAWIENAFNPPGPRPHVKMQRYNGEGQKLGQEVQVSTQDADPTHRPAISSMIDGGFLIVWVDARPDSRIRAQRFTVDGVKAGAEFTVNVGEGFHQSPAVTRLTGTDAAGNQGNYVVAWRADPSPPGGGALHFRVFTFDGTAVTNEIRPNLSGFSGGMSITFIDDGRFAIAHVRNLGLSDIGVPKSTINVTVYEADGADANIPIIATTGGQIINSSSPALASLLGGRFLLTWVQKAADTFATSTSVRARVFSTELGSGVGEEVQVSTATAGDRSESVVARAGGFGEPESAFIAWTDDSLTPPDVSGFAVRARAALVANGVQLLG